MNKAVMISIQPKWCELIASGKKTIEVRKTKPKIDTPFKCYIYCTSSDIHSGLVVGDNEAKLICCCNYKTGIPVGGEYNEQGIWQPNSKGLGMKHCIDVINGIYGKDFIKY